MNLSLKHLEVFYTVMTSGSLTSAASILCVSQPAASKALKLAEHRLGFALFRREKGKLYPTQEAQILFEKMKPIYSELNQLQNLAENLAHNPNGRISIGCLPSLGLCAISQITAAFIKDNPGVFVTLSTQHSDDLKQQLHNRQLDLAITLGFKNDSGLISTPIVDLPLVYIDAKKHPDKTIEVDKIDETRWIYPNAHSLTDVINQHHIFGQTIVDVQTYYMVAEFVKQGIGCSITDILTASFMLPQDMLYPLKQKLYVRIFLIHHRDAVFSKNMQKYIRLLQKSLAHSINELNLRLYGTK